MSPADVAPADDGWFDADAHVIEPPWIWADYTERSLHDRVPRLERRGDSEWIVCDGEDLFAIGRLGGLARGERSLRVTDAALDGSWDASIVPGAYRSAERLEAMAIDGVAHSLLFPTVAMTLLGTADAELRRALLTAYNRWIADLCAEAPGRLFSACIVDPDDGATAMAEITAARAHGHVAVLVPLWSDGDWSYSSDELVRLWSAAADLALPVGFHAFAAKARQPIRQGLDLAVESIAERPTIVARAVVHLLASGVFERVPRLQWFSAENDAGWVPYLLERADRLYARAKDHLPISRPPSELFHDHISVTFTDERVAVANIGAIGATNLMWGSDYPHNVTTWPNSRALVEGMFDDCAVPAATRRAVTSSNAARLFRR
ncbi:MAG: amidohydrolase family protein [Acidimicrobiales bacterium]